MNDKLLEVKNLHTTFATDAGPVQAVRGVSFYVNRGESLGSLAVEKASACCR